MEPLTRFRLVDKIVQSFEKEYCTVFFFFFLRSLKLLTVCGTKAFYIKINFPDGWYNILKSYLEDWLFLVNIGESFLHPIWAGIPQGSKIRPIPYLLFTADSPTNRRVTDDTFTEDTAGLVSHSNPEVASVTLQFNFNSTLFWTKTEDLK